MQTFIKMVATLAALASLLGSGTVYAARADFSCNGNSTCYFTILYTNGSIRNFTMRGGERDSIGGVQRGDRFCVSTTGPNNPYTCSSRPISMYD